MDYCCWILLWWFCCTFNCMLFKSVEKNCLNILLNISFCHLLQLSCRNREYVYQKKYVYPSPDLVNISMFYYAHDKIVCSLINHAHNIIIQFLVLLNRMHNKIICSLDLLNRAYNITCSLILLNSVYDIIIHSLILIVLTI